MIIRKHFYIPRSQTVPSPPASIGPSTSCEARTLIPPQTPMARPGAGTAVRQSAPCPAHIPAGETDKNKELGTFSSAVRLRPLGCPLTSPLSLWLLFPGMAWTVVSWLLQELKKKKKSWVEINETEKEKQQENKNLALWKDKLTNLPSLTKERVQLLQSEMKEGLPWWRGG